MNETMHIQEQRRNASKYFLACCTRWPGLHDYLDEVRSEWFIEDNLVQLYSWVALYAAEHQVGRQSFYSWLSARYPEKQERPAEFDWAVGLTSLPLEESLGRAQFRKLREFVNQDRLVDRLKKVEKQVGQIGCEKSVEQLLRGLEDFSGDDSQLGPTWAQELSRESVYLQDLIKRQNYFLETGKEWTANKIFTQFPRLDAMMGGFQPGRLIVLGARPAVGKSATLLQWAINVAKQQKHLVYMCLEMTRGQAMERLIANFTDTDLSQVQKGTIDPAQWQRILDALDRNLPGLQEYGRWTENKNHTMTTIRRAARQAKQEGMEVLFVDYLQQIKPDPLDRGQPPHVIFGNISRGLKMLSMELNICVVVAAQLNREFDKGEAEPQLRHLKDSGSIEQDADQVLLLDCPSDRNPMDRAGMLKMYLRKNRHGQTGSVDLYFSKDRQQVGELAPFDLKQNMEQWNAIGR